MLLMGWREPLLGNWSASRTRWRASCKVDLRYNVSNLESARRTSGNRKARLSSDARNRVRGRRGQAADLMRKGRIRRRATQRRPLKMHSSRARTSAGAVWPLHHTRQDTVRSTHATQASGRSGRDRGSNWTVKKTWRVRATSSLARSPGLPTWTYPRASEKIAIHLSDSGRSKNSRAEAPKRCPRRGRRPRHRGRLADNGCRWH